MFPRWFYISGIIFLVVIFALFLKNKITSGESFTVQELLHWALKFAVAYAVYAMFIRGGGETTTAPAPAPMPMAGGRRRRHRAR
jgi:hypothetical protein